MANRKPSELAQLTATNASDNDRLLAYVPAEATAANQSKTISLGNIRKKINTFNGFISVKDFGAVGNGVTDDTAAIQAAINYCETNSQVLHVPQGYFLITAPLRVGVIGGLIIKGDFQYTSIFLFDAAEGKNCIEHSYNPITVAVNGTTATITSLYPHGFTSGAVGSSAFGPVVRLPGAFLGPKTITVTSSTTFTFTVTAGTSVPAQTGLICPGYYKYLWIDSLRIACYHTDLAGSAIISALRGDSGPTSLVNLNNVKVGPFGADQQNLEKWNNACTIYSPTSVVISNCDFTGGAPNTVDSSRIGLLLETMSSNAPNTAGNMDGAFGVTVKDSFIGYFFQNIELRSLVQYQNPTGEIHGLEGITFDNVYGMGHHGIKHYSNIVNAVAGQVIEVALQFLFNNCSYECSGRAFDLRHISNVQITSGLQLLNGGEKGNITGTALTPAEPAAYFEKCSGIQLLGAGFTVFFTMGNVAPWTGLKKPAIWQFVNCQKSTISQCVFEAPENDLDCVLSINAGCDGIKELQSVAKRYDNPNTVPFMVRAAGATNCFSTTHVNKYVDASNFVTCDDYGNVELRAQGVVTTDGNRIATVALPAGLFSSVNELIQVQMSGTATADALGYHIPVAMINVDPTPPTTASFKIKYGAGTGMDNKTHRISYYISGKA